MITRRLLEQVDMLIRPLSRRIQNLIVRGVVRRVDDSTPIQSVQSEVLATEVVADCQHLQNYGFTSHPPANSEAVLAFPGGYREKPFVLAIDSPSLRIELQPGEVAIYHQSGSKIVLDDTAITISADTSTNVFIDDGAGGTGALATLADINALAAHIDSHVHVEQGPLGPLFTSTPATGTPASPVPDSSPAASGTVVLEAK